MQKNIEIISLIYKSNEYLESIYSELKKSHNTDWEVGLKIVANDPKEEIIEKLSTLDIRYDIYKDPKPNDYYLNRVYRCWNFAGSSSQYDNICFVNSDMIFSADWLVNLLKHHNGQNIPCSRLVESGKMPSGTHGISVNFGRRPKKFNEEGWKSYSEKIKEDRIEARGLFMPCVFEKKRFIESGMYPEGNIYQTGVGTLKGGFVKSGDDYYFRDVLEKKFNMKHITVFNSIVYHIQEGEKDS